MNHASQVHDNHASQVHDFALSFPEAAHVVVEAWGNAPTYRVRGKNFIFTNDEATTLTLKLGPDEAAAVVASDPRVTPAWYGLGRYGWITLELQPEQLADQPLALPLEEWAELQEWIETSYRLVAPTSLVALLDAPPA